MFNGHKWRVLRQIFFAAFASSFALGSMVVSAGPSHLMNGRMEWAPLIERIRFYPPQARIGMINLAVNSNTAYADDLTTFGVTDSWGNPYETWDRGTGDCEDFAIVKFYIAREIGVPDFGGQVRLAYVMVDPAVVRGALGGGGEHRRYSHVVVLYYRSSSDENPLVLDLGDTVKSLSDRDDLTVYYSFDEMNVWRGSGNLKEVDMPPALLRWSAFMSNKSSYRRLAKRAYSDMQYSSSTSTRGLAPVPVPPLPR